MDHSKREIPVLKFMFSTVSQGCTGEMPKLLFYSQFQFSAQFRSGTCRRMALKSSVATSNYFLNLYFEVLRTF